MESITFPIRINRYLSLRGTATRRDADALIIKKRVSINGRIAMLGDIVQKNDEVIVNTTKADKKSFIYICYYKPVGIITHSPQKGEKSIADMLGSAAHFPVGRLDKESSGLMILTNDGRITDRLLNPKYDHEKEYIVEADKKVTPHALRLLQQGVVIEGYRTKPSVATPIGDHKFRIILREGKKHQIRRMLAAVGMQVVSLKRIRIMNITLGTMKSGQTRNIVGQELATFLKALGL